MPEHPEFTRAAEIIQLARDQLGEASTDRQREWGQRLESAASILAMALCADEKAASEPDRDDLRLIALLRRNHVKLAIDPISRGMESHRKNYEAAHGGSPEVRREGWKQAYANRIMKTKGRVVRKSRRRADMAADELAAHIRELHRVNKANSRAKKRKLLEGDL